MISIIFGPPRIGKTVFMVATARGFMRGKAAHRDLRDSKKLIDQLNAGGWKLTTPPGHLVFSDIPINADRQGLIRSNEADGYYIGLPNNQDHSVQFFPPFARIFLDEAQKYFNSRESQKLADFVSRFYELHGHWRLNVYMTCQRPGLIDLNIREIAGEFIEILELEHKMKHGKIISSTWTYRTFEDFFKVESYQAAGRSGDWGEVKKFTFEGNVFKHYDSYQFMAAHLRERYDRTHFDVIPSTPTGTSLELIQFFNEVHDYTVPETFWKQTAKQREQFLKKKEKENG